MSHKSEFETMERKTSGAVKKAGGLRRKPIKTVRRTADKNKKDGCSADKKQQVQKARLEHTTLRTFGAMTMRTKATRKQAATALVEKILSEVRIRYAKSTVHLPAFF